MRRLALLAAILPATARADATTPSCGGHTACEFGDWSQTSQLPTFTVEVGLFGRRLVEPASSGNVFRGTTHDDPGSRANHGLLRLGAAGHHVYGGGEIDVGSLLESWAGATTIDEMGNRVVDESKLTVFTQYTLFAGVRSRLGPFVVGGELHAGGRTLDYNTRHTADGSVVSATTAVIEPRLRAEWFVRPHVALGMAVATSALHEGELGIGFDVALHSRPYRAQ